MTNKGTEEEEETAHELFLEPVAAYNPFEEALAQLARAIRLGAVEVGEKFPPERELSERLGVSRTTVREAIRGLEQAGYITTRRGRFGGTFVLRDEAKLSARDRKRALGPQLLETLDFRVAVEPGAAALAAGKATESHVEQMLTLVEEMEASDQTEFVRLNCRLHILLAQAANCPPLLKAVSNLELEIMDAFLLMPKLGQSEANSHAQHRAIIEAIASDDPRAARDAMDDHLGGSEVLIRELVSTRAASR